MPELVVDEINEAFHKTCCILTHAFEDDQSLTDYDDIERLVRQGSRYGDVIRIRTPLLITYTTPTLRVLMNEERLCNPFLHLYEAFYMLAGRRDVESLAKFAKRMKTFSDDGQTFHASYGHRWRHHFGGDQLKTVIENLRKNPDSRREVLQMWDCRSDLVGFEHEGFRYAGRDHYMDGNQLYRKGPNSVLDSVDLPCNTQVYVQACQGHLDITVTNRSNDIFWGMLGSNHVQFSFLLEYLAAMAGLKVGLYHHFTTNAHYYTDHFSPEKVQAMHEDTDTAVDFYRALSEGPSSHVRDHTIPLVSSPESFDIEAERFASDPFDKEHWQLDSNQRFIREVAHPMMNAWYAHKKKVYDLAFDNIAEIKQPDWQFASRMFMNMLARKHKRLNPK
jgi:hypothetical protein